ncbi:MAG TPA: cell division protein FtsQ [Cyclobacteriaceae bacterium]|nr:cell division protein FtsQ [Cyclobacteriaceae bacterium]HMV08783.1 cell division protein FtsQ [Cyclobacteriaceae bacterium]HMV91321.1 cell division protein FtsQ [Cyclobacteriaceae bacterium]HMW99928.1 cell division protein FtsQ [Cyclobacteriaceae bacterium]HMX49209.1 cell division protein FtsQ [Cyclobacteriaceae bacterium]
MKINFNIKREIKITALLAVVFLLIAVSERKQGAIAVKNIVIKVENIEGNQFIDEGDVADLMQLGEENLKGASLESLNMKELEKRIRMNRFVKDAQLYSDLKGNLVVKAKLRRPIARLIRNDGPDGYIAEDGTVMPVSDKFTTRVVLISGSYIRGLLSLENLNKTKETKNLMAMLEMIREDDFWRAQIAQLDIDSKGRINILPQIGGQTIEFGVPDNLETKFKKMKIFYKEILPQKGWNTYKRVNLEYEGQIIAE